MPLEEYIEYGMVSSLIFIIFAPWNSVVLWIIQLQLPLTFKVIKRGNEELDAKCLFHQESISEIHCTAGGTTNGQCDISKLTLKNAFAVHVLYIS